MKAKRWNSYLRQALKLHRSVLLPLNVKRANASAANRIGSNVEVCPKLHSFGTIHDVVQGLAMDIAQRRMEKAGANVTGCFDHGRNPRSIAEWRDVLCQAKVSAEVKRESS